MIIDNNKFGGVSSSEEPSSSLVVFSVEAIRAITYTHMVPAHRQIYLSSWQEFWNIEEGEVTGTQDYFLSLSA